MLNEKIKICINTVHRRFRILENEGYISDAGKAKDVLYKRITESHQFRSRVYISNIRIIRKDKYAGNE